MSHARLTGAFERLLAAAGLPACNPYNNFNGDYYMGPVDLGCPANVPSGPGTACNPFPADYVGVGFTPNNQLLVSAGADRTIRFWNPADGKPLGSYGAGTADGEIQFRAPAGGLKDVRMWDGSGRLNGRGLRTRTGEAWTEVALFQLVPRIVEVAPHIFSGKEWIPRNFFGGKHQH